MLSCESCEHLMADALYEPLPAARQELLQAHLDDCRHCRQNFMELRTASESLRKTGFESSRYQDIPERARLDTLWEKLEPALDRIDAERRPRRDGTQVYPFLAGALAMAASLFVFVYVSGITVTPSQPATELAGQPATQVISQELMDYLTRAETMLLLVANSETGNASAVPLSGTFARDMAMEASYISNSMDNSISSGQTRLLKDIEFMLMQIANLDEANMAEGIRLLQNYIEDSSVFLKIRMLEMRDQDTLI